MAKPLSEEPAGAADEAGVLESSDRATAVRGDRTSTPSVVSSSVAIGTRLEGTYEVKSLLGQGAMGAVYLVEHVGLGKQFAAKVVSASRALDESAIARLRNEARITSAIEHENIVNVTHLGATPDGSLFIVMELLRGENLRDRLARQQASAKSSGAPRWLPDEEVRPYVSAVLSALSAAHAAGVIHRDLKPDNVFLSQTRSGQKRPKIVDFGIGKLSSPTGNDLRLTETGQTVGTPLYMAPEQFRASSLVGPQADLYSLGVLTFELLTGELPFMASHVFEMVLKHATERAPDPRSIRPDLPAPVAALLLKCLEKDPEARFRSADEMLTAWTLAWRDARAPATEPRAAERSRPPPAKRADAPILPPRRAAGSLSPFLWPALLIGAAVLAVLVVRMESAAPLNTQARRALPTPVAPRSAVTRIAPTAGVTVPPVAAPPIVLPAAQRVHHITTEPAGAEVLVDGRTVGQTPFDLSVDRESTVVIVLRLAGRRLVERTLDPTAPTDVHVRFTRERRETTPEGDPDYPGLADR